LFLKFTVETGPQFSGHTIGIESVIMPELANKKLSEWMESAKI
jgi:hypothetical protein